MNLKVRATDSCRTLHEVALTREISIRFVQNLPCGIVQLTLPFLRVDGIKSTRQGFLSLFTGLLLKSTHVILFQPQFNLAGREVALSRTEYRGA